MTNFKIMAYIFDKERWEGGRIKSEQLTHINYSFGLIDNGRLSTSHLKNTDKIKEAKQYNPDVKLILSIGGWEADGFSDAVLTDESRNIFVDSIVKFVKENDFDGVDLDWEYPGSDMAGIKARKEDKQNFTAFLKLLREKLSGEKHYIINIAMGASKACIDGLELSIIQGYLDYINIMTYDIGVGQTTAVHHTNLYPSDFCDNKMGASVIIDAVNAAGVPLNKIVMGSGFYGRGWQGVENKETPLNSPSAKTGGGASYTKIKGELLNNGYTRYWDDSAKAPYIFDGDTFISYDDEESLFHKCEYIKQKGIAGIMFWEYWSDTTGSLLNKINECLKS